MNCQHCFSEIQTKICYCPECGFCYHEECWRKNNSKCVQYNCKGKTTVLENSDDKKDEIELKEEVITSQTNNLNETKFRVNDKSKNNQQNIIYVLIGVIFLLVIVIFYFNNKIKIYEDKKIIISEKDFSIQHQKNNYSENNNKLDVKLEEKNEVINNTSIKPSEIELDDKKEEIRKNFSRKIVMNDLINLNCNDLLIMRNEIYARYGRPFKVKELKEYFESKSWYKVNPSYKIPEDDKKITSLELINSNFILSEEKRRKCW